MKRSVTRTRGHDRKLWGVEFSNSRSERHLLGALWDEHTRGRTWRVGEPMPMLLFCTREHARRWCRSQRAKYVDYPRGHLCRAWRFRAVRVRETVQVID